MTTRKRTPEQVAAAAAAKAAKAQAAEAERSRKAEEKTAAGKAKQEKAAAAAKVKEEKAAAKRKADEDKAAAAARVASPERFVDLLKMAHIGANQLFGLSDLTKGLSAAEKTAFVTRWKTAIADGALPPDVGSLLVGTGAKAARKVFLLAHIVPPLQHHTNGKAARFPSAPVKDRLLTEFDRLNERSGGRYYVSLSDLRQALGDVERADFDAALNELRRDWVLTLSPAEGRHESIPAEVLRAGIMENSRLLVYVARRES
jgi:hypothetical protein